MRPTHPVAIALLVLLAGCLEGGDNPTGGGTDEPVEEPVTRIDQGQHSGVEGLAERVIETEEAWAEFWQEHESLNDPPQERPIVDFDQSRVIAVVAETQSSGCYAVKIENVTTQAGVTTVEYVLLTPPEGAVCTAVETTPYDIVKIPAGDTTVAFERETRPMPSPEGAPQAGAGDEAGSDEAPEAVPYERITAEAGSGLEGLQELAIETEEAWASFWENHTADRHDAPERPEVDFAEHRVAAVILETKPNTCWSMRIENVTRLGDETTVHYTVYTPHPDAVCGMAMVQPVDIVKIPADGTHVVFDRSEQQSPPPG